MVNKQLNIGIIGLGTVGSGVVETLEKKKKLF
jgi:homoserine dehydrogenase